MSHYETLGVARGATDGEIKKAYRALVKQAHPDSGNPGDITRFRAIQNAYEVLTDAERRRQYDATAFPVSWTGGFDEPLAPFRELRPRGPRNTSGAHLDIVLSPEEARRGGELVLEAPNERACERCGGQGLEFFGWCSDCRGEGWIQSRERIRFRLARGSSHGDVVTATGPSGRTIRAQIRIR
jgi:DnaJ-class molecular chaperone